MYFEEYGSRSNKTIILLHCAAIVEMYEKILDLSTSYHIVIPHLYGSGKEVGTVFSFDKNLDGIKQIILDLKLEKVFLVGHSEGANLAIAFITQNQGLVEKAVVSSPMIDKNNKVANYKARYIGFLYPFIRSKLIANIYVKFLELRNSEKKNNFKAYWRKISKHTWMNYYSDRYTTKRFPGFEDVSVPIKFLLGSKEPKVIAETVNYLSGINLRCNRVIVQGYGHEHPLKNPVVFKNELLKFFT